MHFYNLVFLVLSSYSLAEHLPGNDDLRVYRRARIPTEGVLGAGLVPGAIGAGVPVTAVTEEHAQYLFEQMKTQLHIPFGYPEDGCYARAHEMAQLMERRGIFTGKIFVEGDLRVATRNSPAGFVTWWYHVAPILIVRTPEGDKPFVIDPSIATRAIPADDWIKLQTSHESGRQDRRYFTRRFNYTPGNSSDDLHQFLDADIQDSNETMANYLLIQRERERLRENGKKKGSTDS